METEWLTYAKRLQAIATTGLHFTSDPFDRERYAEIDQIAQTMLARLGDVPLERIAELVSSSAQGYPTPKVDVGAAVIEQGRILLVRERADGRWALPGGFADIGFTAAENVRREVQEEAGLDVAPRHIFALRHKARQTSEPDMRDFYKLFFLCDRLTAGAPRSGTETTGAAFFAPDELPPLSLGRTLPDDIALAFRQHAAQRPVTIFD